MGSIVRARRRKRKAWYVGPSMRARTTRLVLALALACAWTRAAAADEPKTETASGIGDCRALEERNAKELAMWSAGQPPRPWAYPARETILDAPWMELVRALGHSAGLLLVTAVPHVGFAIRSKSPELLLAWPLSVPFGPALSCSRRVGTFDVDKLRPNRLMLEPSLAVADVGTTFALRPGYRFLVHPGDWFFGIGGGFGSTIELARPKGAAPRAGLSPEAVVQLGACCAPGFVTLAIRGDFYFDGPATPATFSATFGLTWF